MSLVLEALKKLDREKGREERGFVVMAATPWPTRAARRWPWALLVVAVVAPAWWLMSRRAPPSSSRGTPTSVAPAAAAMAPDVSAVPAGRVPPARRPAAGAAGAAVDSTESLPAVSAPAELAVTKAVSAPKATAARAAAAAEPGPPGLRLQAISERDGQRIAILSDRLVHVGDEFDGVRVIAIREAEVEIEVRGQRTTLRF